MHALRYQTTSPAMPGRMGGTANRGVDLSRSTMHFVGLETTMKHMLHSGHLLHKVPHWDRNLFHLFILVSRRIIRSFLNDGCGGLATAVCF